MGSKKIKIISNLFYYSYPLFSFMQYLVARGWMGTNYAATIFKIALLTEGIISLNKIKTKNIGYYLFSLFFIYSLCSGIGYLYSNRPFICYYDALTNYLLPMLMFYIGMNSNIDKGKFINLMTWSLGFVLILTIPAYLSFSPWYVDFIKRSYSESTSVSVDYVLSALRFGGPFADNYIIMYTCTPILAFYLNDIIVNENKRVLNYIIVTIYSIAIILCQQRSAMLFTFIAFPFFMYYSRHRTKNLLYFTIITLLLSMIVTLSLSDRMEDIFSLISDRIDKMSFDEAFGERREKVFRVFGEWTNILFGDGVGVYSHKAFSKGFVSVNDNGWFKLLTENGIVGVFIFLWLTSATLFRALKYKKQFLAEIFIITFFLFAMIGSDSLSMDCVQPLLFWLSIGLIWSPNRKDISLN